VAYSVLAVQVAVVVVAAAAVAAVGESVLAAAADAMYSVPAWHVAVTDSASAVPVAAAGGDSEVVAVATVEDSFPVAWVVEIVGYSGHVVEASAAAQHLLRVAWLGEKPFVAAVVAEHFVHDASFDEKLAAVAAAVEYFVRAASFGEKTSAVAVVEEHSAHDA